MLFKIIAFFSLSFSCLLNCSLAEILDTDVAYYKVVKGLSSGKSPTCAVKGIKAMDYVAHLNKRVNDAWKNGNENAVRNLTDLLTYVWTTGGRWGIVARGPTEDELKTFAVSCAYIGNSVKVNDSIVADLSSFSYAHGGIELRKKLIRLESV